MKYLLHDTMPENKNHMYIIYYIKNNFLFKISFILLFIIINILPKYTSYIYNPVGAFLFVSPFDHYIRLKTENDRNRIAVKSFYVLLLPNVASLFLSCTLKVRRSCCLLRRGRKLPRSPSVKS